MLRVLLICVCVLVAQSAMAQDCAAIGATCQQVSNPLVGGVRVEGACEELRLEELCINNQPQNDCAPFISASVTHNNTLADGECRQTSRACTRYSNGVCDRWLLNFTCWNGPLEHPPADLLDRVFHNFTEDVVNDCSVLADNPNCARREDVITQGYESRIFNGLDVTRAWWRQNRNYDCTDPGLEDSCDPFVGNPVCTQTEHEVCAVMDPNGSCIQMEYAYECDVDPTFEANCAAINVCVGTNCTGIEQDPSEDFPKAAAWLNVLDRLTDDFGCGKEGEVINPITGEIDLEACPLDPGLFAAYDPSLFAGNKMVCNRGVYNCCDRDGQGNCSQESQDLVLHREAEVTHFLQGECTSTFLGTCLSVREHHCVYKSKFARVFQEQAHLQTGIQFGSIRDPDACPGLDIYQLELLDVEAMDFSEVFGDIFDGLSTPVESEITERLTNGVTNFTPEVQNVFD